MKHCQQNEHLRVVESNGSIVAPKMDSRNVSNQKRYVLSCIKSMQYI